MTCREVTSMLDRMVEGVLTPQEADALRRHLDVCPSCCDDLRTYRDVIALAKQLGRDEGDGPPPGLIDRIRSRPPT